MIPVIYPYKMSSKSAKSLAESLGCKRVYPDRNYRPIEDHLIINWGNTNYPSWRYNPFQMLNDPRRVGSCSDKLECLQKLSSRGISTIEHTESKRIASWWLDQGETVIVRTLSRANSGRGIVVLEDEEDYDEIPNARLYTKYFKKKYEFRAHVFAGKIIDLQCKLRSRSMASEDIDYKIRTHTGGWIFTRDVIDVPDEIIQVAVSAVSALGLDFGAVDIGWNEYKQQAKVFEINTAPGIEATTLIKYRDAILQQLGDI